MISAASAATLRSKRRQGDRRQDSPPALVKAGHVALSTAAAAAADVAYFYASVSINFLR